MIVCADRGDPLWLGSTLQAVVIQSGARVMLAKKKTMRMKKAKAVESMLAGGPPPPREADFRSHMERVQKTQESAVQAVAQLNLDNLDAAIIIQKVRRFWFNSQHAPHL